jgi:hypothetical protein
MFAITSSGERIPLNIPKHISSKDKKSIAVYDDDIGLGKTWILSLYDRDMYYNGNEYHDKLIQELEYDHEPTEDEILWAIHAYGNGSFGVRAFLSEGYRLAYKRELI